MAPESGRRTTVTPGTGLLETVVGAVLRRLGGGAGPDGGNASSNGGGDGPTTTSNHGRRHDSGEDRATGRLRTPEECILRAIERAGGATRQSAIVGAVEWSESTVSRKLGDLESRGAVSRYRIGREKLVYLPGHEPAAVESSLAPAGAD